jgi:DNA (cytosine-5)-methyltransferase 1
VTTGFKAAGIRVVGAVDTDVVAGKTFKANHPEVKVYEADLGQLPPKNLRRRLGLRKGEVTILTACAPCQTFSTLSAKNRKARDFRNPLVNRVLDFVEEFEPKAVVMENVPLLAKHWRFAQVVRRLRRLGYAVRHGIVDAADFGVPQRRRRLVLVAIKGIALQQIPDLTSASLRTAPRQTVREAFAALGGGVAGDALNLPRLDYPTTVAERIAAIPADGGSRTQLPPNLRLKCHEKLGASGSGNVYGRMRWDQVAPTLTTRCTTPACGRFLHPVENRAITLREAAVLQSFPVDYKFEGRNLEVQAQIGNAVPPLLAQAISTLVLSILAASRAEKITLAPALLFPATRSLRAPAARRIGRTGSSRRSNRLDRRERLDRGGLGLDERVGDTRALRSAL